MARYTCSFTMTVDVERLPQLLSEVLQSCSLEVQYNKSDYIMARERPGQVLLSKLVTVEVLIDRSITTESVTQINLVAKNEELPLQTDNHCNQIFNLVRQAIADNRQWQLLETVAI